MAGDVKGADFPDLSGFFAPKPPDDAAQEQKPDHGPQANDEGRGAVPPSAPMPEAPLEAPEVAPVDASEPGKKPKTVNVVAYIQDKHRAKLKTHCQRTGKTYVDVLFEAVDELDSEFPEIFAEALAAQSRTSLFARRRQPAKTSADPKAGSEVQVPFRMLLEDRAVLDERADRYTAGNRTEFIRVVLRTYLGRL